MLELSKDLQQAIAQWRLPEHLEFGKTMAPVMVEATYQGGTWQAAQFRAYGDIQISPAAKCFHYGQEIFEGMKAYRGQRGEALLFRPEEHAKRFQASAERMMIPPIPVEIFLDAVSAMAYHLVGHIPESDGGSLYLRPFCIATEVGLKLNIANEYKFFVLAAPVESYFAPGQVKAVVSHNQTRASRGGTGHVKVAGNYGASLYAQNAAIRAGFSQTLWLDAEQKRFVEEFSGMNFFAVIDGKIVTPKLSGTILPGVTRASIIDLARQLGYRVEEVELDIKTLMTALKDKSCSEVFATGTAAVVSSMNLIEDPKFGSYELADAGYPVATALRSELTAIQRGRGNYFAQWSVEANPAAS